MKYYWIKFVLINKASLYKDFDTIAVAIHPYMWVNNKNQEQDENIFELINWNEITHEDYCSGAWKELCKSEEC